MFRWTVSGREYSFVPPVEMARFAGVKVLEKMGAAPNRPPFTEGRTDFKSAVVVLCAVCDVVEKLLRESARQHGVGTASFDNVGMSSHSKSGRGSRDPGCDAEADVAQPTQLYHIIYPLGARSTRIEYGFSIVEDCEIL